MTEASIQAQPKRRLVVSIGLLLLALTVAVLLGRWLAVVQAPLTRHAVGMNLLENGTPEKAAYVFEAPIWQGVALYRAGRYHRAVGAFVTDDSITGLYNMGNAYTHLGLYRGAIAAYEAVLRRRPNHDDARFNLELVREAARREQELIEESRETENAGNWEEGLQESEEQGEPETQSGDQASDSESSPPSEPQDGEQGDQEGENGAGETAAPESQIASENAGGSDKEGEQAEASIFTLSGRENQGADDLSPEGEDPDDAEVIGGEIDRAREEAMADEIVLRRIKDDPAVVLKARLNMALRKKKAER